MDLAFINKELSINGLKHLTNKTICTLELAKKLFPNKLNNTLYK